MMRHIENPGIVTTVYSDIFRYIQGHAELFVALAYTTMPCYIQNPGTFRTGGTFKSLSNMDDRALA